MRVFKNEDGLGRRQFLRVAGATAAVSVTAAACRKRSEYQNPDTIDIGDGSTGAINLLFAVEQLGAALYSRIVLTPYEGISETEQTYFHDIRAHDVAHRDLLKTILGSNAIPTLSIDLAFLDFTDRDKVLTVAREFKDLAVAAYNGAVYLIGDASFMSVAVKMASVEARHAAAVRNLAATGSFADSTILDNRGMDKQLGVGQVLEVINKRLKKRLSAQAFGYMPY